MFESTVDTLYRILEDCALCPRQCHVNRKVGQLGYCNAGSELKVAKVISHFGEEPAISGSKGSGTIFFSHCNLRCSFCQNYQISQMGMGEEMSPEELADNMLSLQDSGCHNINLVTPTSYLPQIVRAISKAKTDGLKIPIVYNTNGYEKVETLKLLEGIIDIYLPDAKYGSNKAASSYSGVENYLEYNIPALKEMKRQVGNLKVNSMDIGEKGVIVRHLVLPGNGADSFSLLDMVARELGTDTHISLMGQYFPRYKALYSEDFGRRLTNQEFEKYQLYLESRGFENGWIQYPEQVDGDFLPDFRVENGWN
ncbi:MAG: radical SAM protein [Pseudomonadota bacterium]